MPLEVVATYDGVWTGNRFGRHNLPSLALPASIDDLSSWKPIFPEPSAPVSSPMLQVRLGAGGCAWFAPTVRHGKERGERYGTI